mmetsp:Transcript_28993/g.35288  ORF Transcript_28993/g.35288 Transcript_28993/m.35288 type:complete len:137 (+) Transcript_28993:558-968(+)
MLAEIFALQMKNLGWKSVTGISAAVAQYAKTLLSSWHLPVKIFALRIKKIGRRNVYGISAVLATNANARPQSRRLLAKIIVRRMKEIGRRSAIGTVVVLANPVRDRALVPSPKCSLSHFPLEMYVSDQDDVQFLFG